jgi:hypothetical protein
LDIYEQLGQALLQFSPELPIPSSVPSEGLVENILERVPKALYYVDRFALSRYSGQRVLQPSYIHQSYPPDLVAETDAHGVETILHAAISHCVFQLVLVLPKNAGFQWILHSFMERSISFYPNFRRCEIQQFHHDAVSYMAYELQFHYRIGAVMLRKMELEVTREVNRLRNTLFRIDLPESVKCLLAHNYLVNTVTYFDTDRSTPLNRSFLQSAYGALIEKQCVCQGFAEAYKRLLDSLGVPCDLIVGQLLDQKGNWHAWNIVHLKNNTLHCHVDVTFDAGNLLRDQQQYFLRDDRFFRTNRTWNVFYCTPCQDGQALLQEARAYCARHRAELLSCGFQAAWLG